MTYTQLDGGVERERLELFLPAKLKEKVREWRKGQYPCDYPTIGEILDYNRAELETGEVSLRFLREAQFEALEIYWYLRLVENTPTIFELYQKYFEKKSDLLRTLGVSDEAFGRVDFDIDTLWAKVRGDDDFVREYRLEVLRETLGLNYPSYILALAMGAGKTVLIGAIFATEFAMALEYPKGPFIRNALVFAPGKTIIESLRQLAETPYDRILPPRLYRKYAAALKLTFTRDGEKDIPVIRKSQFNVIVTNTEKIRIQKEAVKKADLGRFLTPESEEAAKAEVANLRLQAIASLPNLAIFSDEAHHTYGQSLDTELKKVRKTVDYLAQKTNLLCVVNTTGTPYYKRKPLLDVVVWYGLSEGIHDGILKQVAENIKAYSFENDIENYVTHVVEDFFRDYGGVRLPDGTPAKLAMYFPQTDDVVRLKPLIEAKLVKMGLSPTILIEHHTQHEQKEDFDRFKLRDSPHRVALLVDRGVEGWDVPSLFACALARRLKTSNNFVLQAACRCLRQVPGNNVSARIYLSNDNRSILDKELQENYGETLQQLIGTVSKSRSATIQVRKVDIPELIVKQVVRTVVRIGEAPSNLVLTRPKVKAGKSMEISTFTLAEQGSMSGILQQVAESVKIETLPRTIDAYSAAIELSTIYRLEMWTVYDRIRQLYGEKEIPLSHLVELGLQIEEQTKNYETREEVREIALALVKLDGFTKTVDSNGVEIYTAEISYPVSKENLIVPWEKWRDKAGRFGFHYSPYNFDSNPELGYFEQLLTELNLKPDAVEDIYFTGAITNPNQTDFFVDYRGVDGKWHQYTPDFVIKCTTGKCLIVEIKSRQFEAATTEDIQRFARGEPPITIEGKKAVALKKWENLDPERLKYELIFAGTTIDYGQLSGSREFVQKCGGDK